MSACIDETKIECQILYFIKKYQCTDLDICNSIIRHYDISPNLAMTMIKSVRQKLKN